MSVTKSTYPALAMMVPSGKEFEPNAKNFWLRFLSTLSWVEERGFMVEGGVSAVATCRGRWADTKNTVFPSARTSI